MSVSWESDVCLLKEAFFFRQESGALFRSSLLFSALKYLFYLDLLLMPKLGQDMDSPCSLLHIFEAYFKREPKHPIKQVFIGTRRFLCRIYNTKKNLRVSGLDCYYIDIPPPQVASSLNPGQISRSSRNIPFAGVPLWPSPQSQLSIPNSGLSLLGTYLIEFSDRSLSIISVSFARFYRVKKQPLHLCSLQ